MRYKRTTTPENIPLFNRLLANANAARNQTGGIRGRQMARGNILTAVIARSLHFSMKAKPTPAGGRHPMRPRTRDARVGSMEIRLLARGNADDRRPRDCFLLCDTHGFPLDPSRTCLETRARRETNVSYYDILYVFLKLLFFSLKRQIRMIER